MTERDTTAQHPSDHPGTLTHELANANTNVHIRHFNAVRQQLEEARATIKNLERIIELQDMYQGYEQADMIRELIDVREELRKKGQVDSNGTDNKPTDTE